MERAHSLLPTYLGVTSLPFWTFLSGTFYPGEGVHVHPVHTPPPLRTRLSILPLSLMLLYYITHHYITIHYITLHHITLHCIALHYITLHCIALHCIVLYCIVLYCIVLYCIIRHLNILLLFLVNSIWVIFGGFCKSA